MVGRCPQEFWQQKRISVAVSHAGRVQGGWALGSTSGKLVPSTRNSEKTNYAVS